MLFNIERIIEELKSNNGLITRLHAEEIELSLTCNLSDLRTYNYAKNYFPNFYSRIMLEYTMLANQLKATSKELYEPAQRSLDLIKLAGVSFLSRLNTEKENRNG